MDSVDTKLAVAQKTFDVSSMEHKPAHGFQQVYSNNATFSINFFDLSIMFGRITSPNQSTMFLEDQVTVTMSLEHAAALQKTLADVIANYEKTHGPLRTVPPLNKI
jgi:hypothetical protein